MDINIDDIDDVHCVENNSNLDDFKGGNINIDCVENNSNLDNFKGTPSLYDKIQKPNVLSGGYLQIQNENEWNSHLEDNIDNENIGNSDWNKLMLLRSFAFDKHCGVFDKNKRKGIMGGVELYHTLYPQADQANYFYKHVPKNDSIHYYNGYIYDDRYMLQLYGDPHVILINVRYLSFNATPNKRIGEYMNIYYQRSAAETCKSIEYIKEMYPEQNQLMTENLSREEIQKNKQLFEPIRIK